VTLSPGERVGSFQVLASIGAGGMGEVYRAHDARLRRDVALKLLPEEFVRDGERLARFNREAQLLASLNHPNVAAIYGLEEAAGAPVLVLELVEGPTLLDRLTQGRLPHAEAVAVALQLCDALDAAHARGVIHRDLKPANIKLTADGNVKVLDFGLAKALGEEPIADATSSPTLGAAASRLGVLIGTPAYMSPEQAKGRAVDRRADVWALGCVLFEMLAGKRAFDAETLSEVLVQVLERDPDWTRLPADLPPGVARVVRRCLEKDPRRRFHDVADVRLDLDEARSEQRGAGAADTAVSRHRGLGWTVLAALAGAAATLGLVSIGSPRQVPRRAAAQVQIELPPGVQLAVDTEHPVLALSPDGAQLVFVGDENGTRRLYLRRLADRESRPIAGTDGAASPFFSPDGAWVAFYAPAGGLAKVRIASGLPTRILQTTGFTVAQGASWGPRDTVVLAASMNSGLARASLAGDRLQPITAAQFVTGAYLPYAWPHALPDGRHVLFTDKSTPSLGVAVLDLENGRTRALVDGGTSPRFSPSGHVLFARDGALYSVPVDAAGTATTGPERKIMEGLMTHADGAAQFSVAADGMLAYVAGGPAVRKQELVWVDRQGKVDVLLDSRASFMGPKFSPDGRWLALASYDGPNLDVWRYDISRGALSRVTTHPGEDFAAVWSPDASRLALASEIGEDAGEMGPGLAWIDSDGRSEPLLRSPGFGNWEFPTSWSADGAWIAYTRMSAAAPSADVFLFPTRGPREPVALLDTPEHEFGAAFSPDSRWIAFVAHRSEHDEVYVAAFPGPGPWIQISTAGGVEPVWSRDGSELYYREGSRLMAVTLPSRSPERASAPRVLFEGPFERTSMGGGMANYDVSADGRRFVMVRRKAGVMPRTIQLVLNWPAALAAPVDGSSR